ncbi:MAG TPA: YciI family protein [Pseudoxanthomonas sp.]|nr:YciI family protein [Pseudoxanthomonas sp.]
MNKPDSPSEYLVISRGQWDADASAEDIQVAIDAFYVWLDRLIAEGRMKTGQRLATGGATVSRKRIITDGPFGEAKEVVGGYWFILAHSLQEAADLAAENPCMQYGLFYEIRPIDPERGSAYAVTNETPANR